MAVNARRLVVLWVVSVLALAACSGGSPAGTTSVPASAAAITSGVPVSSPAVSLPASSGGPVTGHLGAKLTFANYGGVAVDATLVKVLDPASPNDATEAPLPAATHWVGAQVLVDDSTPDEGATFDAVTSAGSTVTTNDPYEGGTYTLGNGFQGCTQAVGNGQVGPQATYCLAFPVPDGQTLTSLGVKVGGAEIGMGLVPHDQATWLIP